MKENNGNVKYLTLGVFGDVESSIKLGDVINLSNLFIRIAKLLKKDVNYQALENFLLDTKNIYGGKNISVIAEKMFKVITNNQCIPIANIKTSKYNDEIVLFLKSRCERKISINMFKLLYRYAWPVIVKTSIYGAKEDKKSKSIIFDISRTTYNDMYEDDADSETKANNFLVDFTAWVQYNFLGSVSKYTLDKNSDMSIYLDLRNA